MTRNVRIGLVALASLIAMGASLFVIIGWRGNGHDVSVVAGDPAYASDFSYLSQNGNSNCSKLFRESIASMPDDDMIRGSCCGPMNTHVYGEQRRGLAAKYESFKEIPQDPYNVPASLAKRMMPHLSDVLTSEQQQAYDYAMRNSNNKGPCCCQCWRWSFYGGLGKYLVETYGFTGEQIAEVWNFSDGCGGGEDHVYHG